jgi:hypothetical protein
MAAISAKLIHRSAISNRSPMARIFARCNHDRDCQSNKDRAYIGVLSE